MSRTAYVGMFATVLTLGCAKATTPDPIGGETHFLQACDDTTTCGVGLDCVCGVCTKPCVSDNGCKDLSSGATCEGAGTPIGACLSPQASPVCDVQCTGDSDCKTLGATYTCESGSCRKLEAGSCVMNGVVSAACMDAGVDSAVPVVPYDPQCIDDADAGTPSAVEYLTPLATTPLCAEGISVLASSNAELVYSGFRPGPFEVTATDIYLFDERSLGMVRVPLDTLQAWTTDATGIIAGGLHVDGCEIYVANTSGDVRALRTDGSAVRLVAGGGPSDSSGFDQVAVDATHTYLGHYQTLYRVARAGGELEFLRTRSAGGTSGQSMLLLDDRLVWVENTEGSSAPGLLVAIPKSTPNAVTTLASGPRPVALAADATHIYVAFAGTFDMLGNHAQDGSVGRVPLAGGPVETVVNVGRPTMAVNVDSTHVYWLRQEANTGGTSRMTLWRARKASGASPIMLADHVETFQLDTSHVYWSQHCAEYPSAFIVRRAKDAL